MKIGDLVTLRGKASAVGMIVGLSAEWVKVSWKGPGVSHRQTQENLMVVG